MKKYLFMFIFALFFVFGFSFSDIEAKTINTDIGNINFDLEQIKQDNPTLNLSDNYIISKRVNSNQVMLYIVFIGYDFYTYGYNSSNSTYGGIETFSLSNVNNANNNYQSARFVYNETTNSFDFDTIGAYTNSNIIYDTSLDYIKYLNNNTWYNLKLVSSNNFYKYDFINLIDVADFSNDTFNVFTNNFNTVLNDYSILSNYNNSLNNNVKNYILNESYKQYGNYYIGNLSLTHGGASVFITNYPEQIYVKKCTGLYGAGVGVIYDENKPVYLLYNDSSDSMHIRQLTSNDNYVTSSNGNFFYDNINVARGISNLPITSYSWFSNISEIKVYDNFAVWFEDKAYYPGDTIFLTDNNKILYLGGYYEPVPKVTFNSTYNKNSNDNNVSIVVNSVFSIFDVENYKYYYKTNNDSDWIVLAYNQQMIDTKTFTKTFYDNGNLAIKITDMQNNTLATYTYQWDQIDTKNGIVTSFGNNSFGINSRYVSIMSGLASTNKIFDTITCEKDRAFSDNTCYVNFNDFNTDIDDYLNSVLGFSVVFNENYASIPLESEKYYLLNYRVFSDFSFTPDVLRLVSGSSNIPATILDFDVKEHGIYKDYVITFQTTSSEQDLAITGIQVIFSNLRDLTDNISNNFKIGVYNSFKIQQYNHEPTDVDVNNFYNKNSLDSISKGNPSDFFNSFSINDFGLSSLIKKPLDLLSYVVSEDACAPIELPFPHSNEVITLPCLQSVLSEKLGILFTIIQVIFSGLICYRVGVGIFKTIKDLINPKNDKIEVVDL